ncbi:unnamed protein product [Clonostachys solani]|uniref:Rhodopsin domain-containing protein n=1 Tax=Clonostachys solani TaxID=160281 RepID=A0A9N9Z8R5_9HYPO|nr:unnamed protein product [Clonostachys solani]
MTTINGVPVVLPAPDGYVVDFDNPQRTGVPDVYFIAGFGGALSLLFFGQRMYVKLFLAGGVQLDDSMFLTSAFSWFWSSRLTWLLVLLILSVLMVFATSGFTLHMFANGIGGVHAWEISITDYNRFLLDTYIAAFLYPICGSFAKLSLLVFYLQLSPQKWFKMATWATIAIIIGYTIGINLPLIFACQPIQKSWDATITHGHCLNLPSLYIATAVANIVSDVILFILPLPMVVGLHIPRRQKIGLVIIFGIGSLTVITSVVRVALLPQMLGNPDGPWMVGVVSVWTQVEGYLIIMCASLPTFRKFIRHVAPKLLGESRYGSKTKTNENSHPPSRTLVPNSQSRRDRHQYSQFDPEEGHVTTETFVMGPVSSKNKGKGRGPDQIDGWADSDSERAIVATPPGSNGIARTTVVTVEVEHRSSNEGSKP